MQSWIWFKQVTERDFRLARQWETTETYVAELKSFTLAQKWLYVLISGFIDV